MHLNKLGHVSPLMVMTKFTAAQKPCNGGETLAGSFWSPGNIRPNKSSFPPPKPETADQEANECELISSRAA